MTMPAPTPGQKTRLAVVAAIVIFAGCSGPHPETTTLEQADRLVLRGLPHQMYEPGPRGGEEGEAVGDSARISVLSRDPRAETRRRERLKTLLSDPGSYAAYSGEKKCGGFHPDHAVEWTAGGRTYQVLICFGCFEAKIYGPKAKPSMTSGSRRRNSSRYCSRPIARTDRRSRRHFEDTLGPGSSVRSHFPAPAVISHASRPEFSANLPHFPRILSTGPHLCRCCGV